MRKNRIQSLVTDGQTKMKVNHCAVILILLLLGSLTAPTVAANFTVSNFGDGSQIWFQAEDYDQRIPDNDDFFAVVEAPVGEEALVHPIPALSQEALTINRLGGPGGRISYDFNINQLGEAGTWYFWGRVINPNNLSDFILVEGHPGDVIPTTEPFQGDFNNDQRLFERNTGPPFGWSGGGEGHIKQLQDGANTMHIVHRQGGPEVYWDVMMWTDDPDYVPTDGDFLDSEVPTVVATPGDFNGDDLVNAADYQIMLDNFNTDVERGQDGDATFNGHVDYRDFVRLRSTIDESAGGVQTVPEPSTWGLLSIAVLLFVGRRRSNKLAVALLALGVALQLSAEVSFAQESVIVQREGTDYLAFEAEDYFDLNNGDDATGWNVVGVTPDTQFQSPAPVGPASLILDPRSTNASRRAAIFDFPGGNDQDFVRYRLKFVEDGDYSLYLRYSLYNLRDDAGYGNEDSTYISSEFGLDGELIDTLADPRGPRDGPPSFYATYNVNINEGNFGWWNASANGSDETAENPDAIYTPDLDEELDFGIAAREAGVAFDRIVFHTNPNLSDAELDALISFDPVTFGLDPNDFNQDGSVDSADVNIIRANLGDSFAVVESFPMGDGNRDGIVDLRDFLQIRQVLNPGDPGLATVPEPTGVYGLLIAGILAIGSFRKRRR